MKTIYKNKIYRIEQGKELYKITYYDEQRSNKKFNKDKKVKRSALTRDINVVNTYLPANLKIKGCNK
ncbi:hypothetical protein [Clostridioides difficile]|uniref:hypothetical protein n=1 Tax=Clostridioides difficile TaxID=1496 RepID=UPI002FCDA19F